MTWQGWEELFELAHFIGVSRPGYELSDAHIKDAFHRLPDDALRLVEIPALAISSTDCRRRRSPPPAGRSGTWCPTAWSSTSPNAVCIDLLTWR